MPGKKYIFKRGHDLRAERGHVLGADAGPQGGVGDHAGKEIYF